MTLFIHVGPDSLSDRDLEFPSARSGPIEIEPPPNEQPDQPGMFKWVPVVTENYPSANSRRS